MKTIDERGIKILFDMYEAGNYPFFFRHVEQYMNIQEFAASLTSKWFEFEHGFVSVDIQPKARLAVVSVLVYQEYQCKGIAFKKTREVMEHLFSSGVSRVVMIISSEDERLKKILHDAYFTFEGRYIDSYRIGNKFGSELRYGMSCDCFLENFGGKHG